MAGEQNTYNAGDEGPEQGALFRISGPDERGSVSLCAAEGCEQVSHPLGRVQPVAEVLMGWLAGRDFGASSGPVRGAQFQIEGADEDGCVWACSSKGRAVWCLNLGPEGPAAEEMVHWLAENECGE